MDRQYKPLILFLVIVILVVVLVEMNLQYFLNQGSNPAFNIKNSNRDLMLQLNSKQKLNSTWRFLSQQLKDKKVKQVSLVLTQIPSLQGYSNSWQVDGNVKIFSTVDSTLTPQGLLSINIYINYPLVIQYNWRTKNVNNIIENSFLQGLVMRLDVSSDAKQASQNTSDLANFINNNNKDNLFKVTYVRN